MIKKIFTSLAIPILFISLFSTPASSKISDEAAIHLLLKKIKKDPKDANAYYRLGWYMQKRSYHAKAKVFYYKCLSIDKKFVSAYINLGNIYNKNKNYRKAERYYQKAISLNRFSSLAHYNMGAMFLKEGKLYAALDSLEKSVILAPENIRTKVNLSAIYLRLYRKTPKKEYWVSARNHLLKAKDLNNRYAKVYYNLGKLYELNNQITIAIQYYREAVRFFPNSSRYKTRANERMSILKSRLN